MAMKADYEYPPSPPAESEISSKLGPKEADMANQEMPSTPDNSNQPPSAIRRSRSPPRNDEGDIFCDHPNCRDKTGTFRRLCEWNKHMDRHERPYKCHENGCELSPGFTYSGGLLRHQREVHKMHLSTKQPLYCPVPNCNRSSGAGFTRKENLEEHKRRRHVGEIPEAETQPSPPPTNLAMSHSNGQISSKKRRRMQSRSSDDQDDEEFGQVRHVAPGFNNDGSIIKRLRLEIAQKDEYIRRQTVEIQRLQNLIRSLPPQAIYGAMTPNTAGTHLGQ